MKLNFNVINIFSKTKNLESVLNIYKDEFLKFNKAFSIYKENEEAFDNNKFFFRNSVNKEQMDVQLKILTDTYKLLTYQKDEDGNRTDLIYLFEVEFNNLKSNNKNSLIRFINSNLFYLPRFVSNDFVEKNKELLKDYIELAVKKSDSLDEENDLSFIQKYTQSLVEYIKIKNKYESQKNILKEKPLPLLQSIHANFEELNIAAYEQFQTQAVNLYRSLAGNMLINFDEDIFSINQNYKLEDESFSDWLIFINNLSTFSNNNYEKILIKRDKYDNILSNENYHKAITNQKINII